MRLSLPQFQTPSNQQRLILPIQAGAFLLLAGTVLTQVRLDGKTSPQEILSGVFWLAASAYSLVLYKKILPSPRLFGRLRWVNTCIVAFGVITLRFIFPQMSMTYSGLYALFAVALNAILGGRAPAYFTFVVISGYALITHPPQGLNSLVELAQYLPTPLATLIVAETILRLQDSMQEHIHRLEIVNEFARRSAFLLDTGHVLSTLNSAIQSAIKADTYFVGIYSDDRIRLELFYDDGEYFASQEIEARGTLSSWVIRNNQTLFISDLREEPHLDDVSMVQIGKERLNLCWLGVPMRAAGVTGLLAVASYRPNALTRNDVELVENLSQHTAQALSNTIQHARVEEQTYLDSLTGVYNHGHFLKVLGNQAQELIQKQNTLSLIMLDVDYFKQYNDRYGHLAGDDVLTSLCSIIRRHIKSNDAVGRWGGEEFVISLPNADGPQARRVCERIQESMKQVSIQTPDGSVIVAPTVSQGIATFPEEAESIMGLIDLADKRLYVAKERGRNQIEPDERFWQKPRPQK